MALRQRSCVLKSILLPPGYFLEYVIKMVFERWTEFPIQSPFVEKWTESLLEPAHFLNNETLKNSWNLQKLILLHLLETWKNLLVRVIEDLIACLCL